MAASPQSDGAGAGAADPRPNPDSPSSQTLSLLRLLATVPGIGIVGYALGGLILSVQARDAGLPWHAVLASQSDRGLLLSGLQMLSYVAILLLAGVAVLVAMLAWSQQKQRQSGLRSLCRFIRRLARRCGDAPWLQRLRARWPQRVSHRPRWPSARARWGARWFVFLAVCGAFAAALLVALVSELFDADVSDGLRYWLWAAGAAFGVIVGWPWPRPWEQRPLALSAVVVLALFSMLTLPLQMAVWVLGIMAAFAFVVALHFEAGRDGAPRPSDLWRPEMLVAVTFVMLASGLFYAMVTPFSTQTVLVGGDAARELRALGYPPERAGLLAMNDTEVIVAVCRAEQGYGRAPSVIALPRENSTFTVRSTPYRFRGEQSASLLNVTFDGVVIDSSRPPTSDPLCGEQVERARRERNAVKPKRSASRPACEESAAPARGACRPRDGRGSRRQQPE